MKPLGPMELNEDVRSKELCVECGACIGICPYIKTHKGKSTTLFECDSKLGRCFAHCPKTEVNLGELYLNYFSKAYEGSSLGIYRQIYKGKSKQNASGKRHQNGGVVTTLLSFALQSGIIDAAALTDKDSNMIPVPRLVTLEKEIKECSGSKYMVSPSLSSYNKANNGRYKNIGVVGTPCQLTALAKIRSNPLGLEDFRDSCGLTVGLFCSWALDARSFRAFLIEKLYPELPERIEISPPPEEKMIIETSGGKSEISLSDLRGFIPKGCIICPDMTSEFSDISVGELEGNNTYNTLIVRTKKGEDLVHNAVRENLIEIEQFPKENLNKLSVASENKKRKAFLNAKKDGLLNNSKEGQRSALILPGDVVNRILTTEKEIPCLV